MSEAAQPVYISDQVKEVERLHRDLLTDDVRRLPIRAQLDRQAHRIVEGHQAGDRAVVTHITCWHPKLVCHSADEIMGSNFTLDDARHTIAREYGASVIAVTKPNSPLAAAADISLGLYVPETPNALKPTASRFAFLAAIDLLAALTAYRSPRETQERMRRIKYALGNFGDGEAEGPLGD